MHRTISGLMARGIDRARASRLQSTGWTISRLQRLSDAKLRKLKFSSAEIAALRSKRSAIPFDVLMDVCAKNRWACCVCRQTHKSIVVHHISSWAETHDHSIQNLAVVCPDHHSEAHTRRDIAISLTPARLRRLKSKWEEEVLQKDIDALAYTPALEDIQWYYINHVRAFELASTRGIKLSKINGYKEALKAGLISKEGRILVARVNGSWMYQSSNGNVLYNYTRSVLEALWSQLPLIDISDQLDRSLLPPKLASSFVYIQGAHTFKTRDKGDADQVALVRRTANRVEMRFTIDRSEATSCSAWSTWLRGRQSVGAVLRVHSWANLSGKLVIEATAIGICAPLSGMATRRYDERLWSSGLMHRKFLEEE